MSRYLSIYLLTQLPTVFACTYLYMSVCVCISMCECELDKFKIYVPPLGMKYWCTHGSRFNKYYGKSTVNRFIHGLSMLKRSVSGIYLRLMFPSNSIKYRLKVSESLFPGDTGDPFFLNSTCEKKTAEISPFFLGGDQILYQLGWPCNSANLLMGCQLLSRQLL